MQNGVCNLYLLPVCTTQHTAAFTNAVSTLAEKPAAATFVDTASDFRPSMKQKGVASSWGMWTGWFRQEKAGTYTFLCKRKHGTSSNIDDPTMYSIWINGVKCVDAGRGQESFDIELKAGFNAVKIIAESPSKFDHPLSISYKKKGSVMEPLPFGPENLFCEVTD